MVGLDCAAVTLSHMKSHFALNICEFDVVQSRVQYLKSSAVMKLMSVTMTDYRPGYQVSIPSWNKEFVTPINVHTVSVIRPCKGKRDAVPGNHSPWALIWSPFQRRMKVNIAWNVISCNI
jgi:hypothetical protein